MYGNVAAMNRNSEISFGRHRGKQIAQLPPGYLRFIVRIFDRSPALISAAETELLERDAGDVQQEPFDGWEACPICGNQPFEHDTFSGRLYLSCKTCMKFHVAVKPGDNADTKKRDWKRAVDAQRLGAKRG